MKISHRLAFPHFATHPSLKAQIGSDWFIGLSFARFELESGVVFEGTTEVYERIYRFDSKLVRKKEKYVNSNVRNDLPSPFTASFQALSVNASR